jgi:8-oxo-dGTP diphosphatase
MSEIRYRRRGTAIVETERGILLTAGRHGPFILPGGGANKGESRLVAAIRELKEETGLSANFVEILFKHNGKIQPSHSGKHKFQDHHTVCVVKATGKPRPGGGDAKRLAFFLPDCDIHITSTTRQIIERYYEWKKGKHKIETYDIVDEDEFENDDEDNNSLNEYDLEE